MTTEYRRLNGTKGGRTPISSVTGWNNNRYNIAPVRREI